MLSVSISSEANRHCRANLSYVDGQIELRTPFCAANNASPFDLHRSPKFDFNPEIFNKNRKNSVHFCHFTYESSFNLVVLSCPSMKIDVSATKGQRDFRPGKSGCVCRTYKLDYRKHL
uniref:(northern house mosquito) hypothetical protein n=1 Tax=Culex pipiens TaxID=7175 RepID=A0A8D8NUV3_CULPI